MARTEAPSTVREAAEQPSAEHAPRTAARRSGSAWLQRRDVREPLTVFLLTRLLFALLTYFGVILFNSVLHGPHPSFLHQLLPAWNNPKSQGGWDTQWYIDIARRGYAWKKSVGTSPTAFFPLYPLLIHAGVSLTHRSYLTVALAVSNLSYLAALIYLWRLTAWEFDRETARRTILYISVFPTALFFFAGYTESLFLLLTVASFYHLRRRDWILAGVLGALASATRVNGVLLALPFAYEYALAHNFSARRMLAPGLVGLALIPVGLLSFMVYLQRTVGDALAFSHLQTAWQKIFTLDLSAGFFETLRQLLIVQPAASFYEAHNLIELGVGSLFLLLTLVLARRLPASYVLYVGAFWLVTLTSPATARGYAVPWISMSRYVVVLFPIFMTMALLGRNRTLHDAWLVLSTALLALLTIQFINGGWVI